MRSLVRSGCLSVAALVVAAVLAGCGDSDKGEDVESGPAPAKSNGIAEMPPAKIVRTGLEANRAAKDLVDSGQLSYYFPVGVRAFEATITATARDCVEELASDRLGKLTTRVVKGTVYSRGSAKAMSEVLELPVSYVELIGNRWLIGDRDDLPACSREGLINDDLDITSCQPGGDDEVEGTPTVVARCMKSGIELRIHVATTGEPLIMRMEELGPSGDSLTLVDANSGVRITAPPKRDVIDTAALE